MSSLNNNMNLGSVSIKLYTNLIIGPLFFLITMLLLPSNIFPYAARGAVATIIWMALWWTLRPVHIGVTAFLPVVVNALFNFVSTEEILTNYASPIVMLVIGANMITVTWSACGLDKRLALRALCLIGPSIKQQLVVWFGISVILTMFLPNMVVAAVLTPIAISMLTYTGLDKNIGNSKIATAILLAIAWGSGLGGFGSPLGGAMNLIAINLLEDMVLGREYMYITWMIRMIPILFLLSAAILVYLVNFKFETKKLSGSKMFFKKEYEKLPSLSKAEKWSLLLFLGASSLAFGRPLYEGLIPGLKPPYIFLLFGLLTFIVPGNNGERLSTWNYTVPRLMWGLFYLFAGGLAIGKFITISGAGNIIGELLTGFNLSGGFFTIALFVIIGILLSNISSNTAACAIIVPIVINIIQSLNLNPIPYVYIAAVAGNCAFILPTSVRAIPVGYGLDPGEMFKKGLFAVLISFLMVTLIGYLFLNYWPGFSAA